MTFHQQKRLDWLEAKGYLFTVSRVPYGRGALLLIGLGHWVDLVELVLNTDGSFHQAYFESANAYLGAGS